MQCILPSHPPLIIPFSQSISLIFRYSLTSHPSTFPAGILVSFPFSSFLSFHAIKLFSFHFQIYFSSTHFIQHSFLSSLLLSILPSSQICHTDKSSTITPTLLDVWQEPEMLHTACNGEQYQWACNGGCFPITCSWGWAAVLSPLACWLSLLNAGGCSVMWDEHINLLAMIEHFCILP